jgi:hypothetical protein
MSYVTFPSKELSKLGDVLILWEARSVTKYLRPDLVITATRRVFGGRVDRRDNIIQIMYKIGRPNFRERQFIKDCKKAGVSFPVRKIQIRRFKER